MEYYFTESDSVDEANNILTIGGFEYKHLTKVLRKKKGELIVVTDGKKNIYHCRITDIGKTTIECRIENKEYNLNEPAILITLYLSLLRNLSRFEFAVEKAVELGVTEIVPVISDFCVSKDKLSRSKIERLRKIMIGAMGQSQRCVLPGLSETIDFSVMIDLTRDSKNKIAMYEKSDDMTGIRLNPDSSGLSLLIGPEGGFSEREIEMLQINGWVHKSLGKRKLRSETAALVSVYEILNNHDN